MSRDILLKGSQRCFPFDKNICFELLEIYSDEWNNIFRNFRKRDNLARYSQILGNVVPGISVPSYFPAGIFRISVERFASRKFNIFRIFWKLSPKISVPFFAVSNFLKSAPE